MQWCETDAKRKAAEGEQSSAAFRLQMVFRAGRSGDHLRSLGERRHRDRREHGEGGDEGEDLGHRFGSLIWAEA